MTLAAHTAGDATPEQPDPSPQSLQPIDRVLVSGDAVSSARSLLGALVVRDDAAGRRVGRVVETEAYAGPSDQASHARAGRTARTSVMFGPPGLAYVYLVYGMHHCLNVVCGPDGRAAAVLIRAVEPVAGIDVMRKRRGRTAGTDADLGAGPARTCQALDIDRGLSGLDLISDQRLWLADDGTHVAADEIVSGPRIGIEYAGSEWAGRPWRFGVAASGSLSKPFAGAA